ncbi:MULTISPECIES: Uma2 family endonuclease [Cyanophyceae]|uniref:Uma2 family endonuclease n=1 Tax=Cyanophyceae TaxID=3028117 RepID=UPI0016872432|nr:MULTISPECIES: Uma2 family endonuclease [Cyanophyceae]MBD1917415.1 Uma2 family endonuclease [Phormidium sp. FACHB-77]MBD2032340.1 Uma2 family endonuclease [Phormidium sp. FACHB-322]MBD2052278.1 Uma2 family endonuclease [Leptolyngbya sp. FACHB-60]
MVAAPQSSWVVTWEKLPDDFILDDEPVDNINQPAIAAALTESLELNGLLPTQSLVMTNYGLCSTVNGKTVVKAPDWGYVPQIRVPRKEVTRSYTPQLQGDFPVVVMEFLSDTEGGEYSIKPTYPPGKWFFYEQVLRVPNYIIFEPDSGLLEAYALNDAGQYKLRSPDTQQRFWIDELGLDLGVWQGTRENHTGYWLRWWDAHGDMLPWGKERAEQEHQRAERLAAQLRAAGIEPEE